MPGMARSVSSVETPSNTTSPSTDRACQRAQRRGAGRDDAGLFERRIGELIGRWKQTGRGRWLPSIGVPHRSAIRPAIVVAALDRDLLAEDRAHGDLEGIPGARGANAGVMRPRGRRSSGSPDNCSAISDGSAPRSNMRRTRSTIVSSARGSPSSHIEHQRGDRPLPATIAIVPWRRRSRSCAGSGLSSTSSTPGVARAARKPITASQS